MVFMRSSLLLLDMGEKRVCELGSSRHLLEVRRMGDSARIRFPICPSDLAAQIVFIYRTIVNRFACSGGISSRRL